VKAIIEEMVPSEKSDGTRQAKGEVGRNRKAEGLKWNSDNYPYQLIQIEYVQGDDV